MQFKLTRIAPTPSGYLHIGNAYSFALTAALAKNTGAEILLRIDDLDRDRIERAYLDDVFDTLNFLAIPWQRGPLNAEDHEHKWSQLSRLNIYGPAMDRLAEQGYVFACVCSRRQLQTAGYECNCSEKNIPLETKGAAWRLFTDDRVLNISTLTQGSVTAMLPRAMKNFVVRKKDGYPAYQLTSLLDDVHFNVDLIVRGEDLWASTIAQHYLASILGINAFIESTFHHHKLIMADSESKLSKSAGSTSIRHMRGQGMSPANIYTQIGNLFSPQIKIIDWRDLSHNLQM